MFCVVRLKSILFCAMVLLVSVFLAISFKGGSSASVFFGYNNRLVPVYSVATDKKQVAISFDASWGGDKTQGIIEILNHYNVDATFFLTGGWVDEYPNLVKEIDENGFEIGNHSNTHPDLTKVNKDTLKQEIEITSSKIKNLIDKDVKVFRSPFGAYNNDLINCCQSLGMIPVQWSVDSLDWKGISAKQIYDNIVCKVKNGSIILCHNNSDNILDALPLVLDTLTMKGYEITCVSSLVLTKDYTIDHAGVQHAN